jgi:hypothetical protein
MQTDGKNSCTRIHDEYFPKLSLIINEVRANNLVVQEWKKKAILVRHLL